MANSGCRTQHATMDRGSTKCTCHQGVCEDCDDVACEECSTKLHSRYALEGHDDVIPEVKRKIHGIINRIQETQIPMVKKEIQAIGDSLSKNKQHFKNLIKKIEKQNGRLKDELDKITKHFTDLCLDMEKENSKLLQDYKTRLQTVDEKLSSQLSECKDILQSGTNVQVSDYSRQLCSEFETPPKPELQTAEFTEGNVILQQLEKFLGEFSKDPGQRTATLKQNLSVSWKMSSQFQLDCDYDPTTMQATPDQQAMVCLYPSDRLISIDSIGQTQTIEMDVEIQDFCFSSVTGKLWICSERDNIVREVNGTTSSAKFRAKEEPRSICVTADGSIVIGFWGGVIKYTQSGQKLCETSYEGKIPQVIYPRHISECPRTKNLAVVDLDYSWCGNKSKPRVVILDPDLQVLYTYHGEGLDLSLERQFYPSDAQYNDRGEIVITSEESVVMISGEAEYIETVYTDTEFRAECLCLQTDGSIWVIFQCNTVKIFRRF